MSAESDDDIGVAGIGVKFRANRLPREATDDARIGEPHDIAADADGK
jgi:hypothetical protein